MCKAGDAVGLVITVIIAAPSLRDEQRQHVFQIVGIEVGIVPEGMRLLGA